MKRATFDPNRHGLFTWPEMWAAEAVTALEQLTVEMKVRHPHASLVPGGCAIYAMHEDVVIGVAWIEPELVEGRVLGVERYIGALAGRA